MRDTGQLEVRQGSALFASAARRVVGWLPLLGLLILALSLRAHAPAWLFMWTLAFAIFAGLKWITWWEVRESVPHSSGRALGYLILWPGMDAETFLDSRALAEPPPLREWSCAAAKTVLGVVLLWVVSRRIPEHAALARGWIGLLGLVLILHFGTFHLIALAWQALGVRAEPIMAKPIFSKTLSEFWGKRWNLGFRQLAYELIFRPLHRRIGAPAASFLVFLASGIIHDLVISFPARGGYGLPTLYFILQGLGVTLERSNFGRQLGLQEGISGWFFMFLMTAAPAFWLFHPPFVVRVILPFMHVIHAL